MSLVELAIERSGSNRWNLLGKTPSANDLFQNATGLFRERTTVFELA